ncbi:uncharacterized protein LOC116617089 isoform X2 [Nematostella vectensis]|uniref:uncharacterized protein LOC116617089 isoform X2 n=1 Tax=Nematostella vectensis TaxID=45351 RepID=UPI002076FDE3|nr:uncharacterized protein LOC116617089 isoform X2 [Nematostella vectensis]XP_032235406.2 uncharacterized protein LOC116617089 isoform X2 [Nematostella vectensis]XP_048583944.1 uncharacterized protein LOC116617089 isoform X2 [Nematostella vectensis]
MHFKAVILACLATLYWTSVSMRDDVSGTGHKRAIPAVLAKIAANKQVQEAVVEKGIEVAGKLIDKQLKTWEEQGAKAEAFLKKKIKLDIMPDKGWESTDMFVPAGYHINSHLENENAEDDLDKPSPTPYNYPAGIGSVIMNGCWGTGYKPGDPCYNAMENTTQCRNMIDGAAFIGVGFDLRGEYSPESRKMSIIQRSCGGHSMYDNFQVPDTMNVHGIYDTSATMFTFSSRSEYQHFLEGEAGVSGSLFGFYGGVKKAWGSSTSTSSNSYLSVFDIDVDRYEIFKDEVKPQDLSRAFLREFMSLPASYFDIKAPLVYQDFVLRWGTHYIKSARFGGQLELRKTVQRTSSQTKEQVSEKMEAEYRSLFWSAGATSSTNEGTTNRQENKFTSSSIVVQGGSQEIASILSDEYAPTFKNEFKAWLQSINDYPKAFKFHLSAITDLLDFRANDLFPDETITWGCEGKTDLLTDPKTGKKYYEYNLPPTSSSSSESASTSGDASATSVTKRQYCETTERQEVGDHIKRRRDGLKRAIEVYMEEGPISVSDVSLKAGEPGCQSARRDFSQTATPPKWTDVINPLNTVKVTFDMKSDLVPKSATMGQHIARDMTRVLKLRHGKWYTSEADDHFHAYDGYKIGGTAPTDKAKIGETASTPNMKVSIYGLVLRYDETDGSLILENDDFAESKKFFDTLPDEYKGQQLAKIEWTPADIFRKSSKDSVGNLPCNVDWSNTMRFDPRKTSEGNCLHFTASTAGSVFVVFSAIPKNEKTWYYVEISPYGVGIYKAQKLQVSTVDSNAVGLGDSKLYQSYFVCLRETDDSTIIEYGKTSGRTNAGDVYLTMIDAKDKVGDNEPLKVRFYAFGNDDNDLQVMDAHIQDRAQTQTKCMGSTKEVPGETYCLQDCHEACDPLVGCKEREGGKPAADQCNRCLAVRHEGTGECLAQCPVNLRTDKNNVCRDSYELSFPSKAEVEDSAITGLNFLTDFSVCFWVKLSAEQGKQLQNGKSYPIISYVQQSRPEDDPIFQVYMHKAKTLVFGKNLYGRNAFGGRPIAYDKWFSYCHTVNFGTMHEAVYKNNERDIHQPLRPLSEEQIAAGPGIFYISANVGQHLFPGTISDINIWDRALSYEDRKQIHSSCGGLAGNAKDWYEIGQVLTDPTKFNKREPATCKGPIASGTQGDYSGARSGRRKSSRVQRAPGRAWQWPTNG